MLDRLTELWDDLVDMLKVADWKKIILASVVPAVIAFFIGGLMFSKKSVVTQNYTVDEVGKLFSVQDLPTQVGDIENNELRVLQSQLADIQTEEEEDEHGEQVDFALNFTKLNAETDLNNFFKTLLAIPYDTKIDTAYKSIKPYLASVTDEIKTDDKKKKKKEEEPAQTDDTTNSEPDYNVQQNIYNMLGSQSWGKETQSQTALSGTIMVSVLSGTTTNNRYFQVIVPATNDNRDFALLNYIVKTNKSGKIIACTYTGAIKGYADLNTYYQKLNDLLQGNTVKDENGEYVQDENKADLSHHKEEE
jgi:hypothetical protein